MSAPVEATDFNDPASVVGSFIHAMNAWEIESWQASRACRTTSDPSAYQPEVRRRMDAIFARFCTPKERKFGRQASFQKPPEYDPEKEQVLATEIDEAVKRAHVTTHRQALLGGGKYQYTLIQRGGAWLIDSLKREENGAWENAIL